MMPLDRYEGTKWVHRDGFDGMSKGALYAEVNGGNVLITFPSGEVVKCSDIDYMDVDYFVVQGWWIPYEH